MLRIGADLGSLCLRFGLVDLLLFLCLGSPAAARAAMGAGGVCGLFSAYAVAALKPYSRLR